MSVQRRQLEAAINGLESQRAVLGDSLVDAALEALRAVQASMHHSMAELLTAAGDPAQRDAFLSRAVHQQLLAAWAKSGATRPAGDASGDA